MRNQEPGFPASLHRAPATCAAFIKESRMELASATNTNRNPGIASIVDCSSWLEGTAALPPLPLLAEDFGKEMADAMEESALVRRRGGGCRCNLRLRRRRAGGGRGSRRRGRSRRRSGGCWRHWSGTLSVVGERNGHLRMGFAGGNHRCAGWSGRRSQSLTLCDGKSRIRRGGGRATNRPAGRSRVG